MPLNSLFKKALDAARSLFQLDDNAEDFLRGHPEMMALLSTILEEAQEKSDPDRELAKLSVLDSYKAVKKMPHPKILEFIKFLLHVKKHEIFSSYLGGKGEFVEKLLQQLLQMKIAWKPEELLEILDTFNQCKPTYVYRWPFSSVLGLVERAAQREALSKEIKISLRRMKFPKEAYQTSDKAKVNQRIDRILENDQERAGGEIKLPKDFVGIKLKSLYEEEPTLWKELIPLFRQGKDKSSPSQKWFKQVAKPIEGRHPEMITLSQELFDALISLIREIHKDGHWEFIFISEESVQYIRALVWAATLYNDSSLNNKIEELGLISFRKLPSYGAVSVKIGNASIYAFSLLPPQEGISRLTKYKAKIKYKSVKTLIENTIRRVSEKQGKSKDELEEMAVKGFGLLNQEYREEMGEFTALIRFASLQKVELLWENQKGKRQKTVPSALKEGFGAEIKALKARVKEMQTNLSAQKNRLQSFYLKKMEMDYARWEAFYFQHPFMSYLTQHLIWVFREGEESQHLLPRPEGMINARGEKIDLALKQPQVSLWHPIYSNTEEIEAWRNYFLENEIAQPFKQAFREIYILTEAERNTETYSNRFASHILRQHQFLALTQQRNWEYTLMGVWDSYNTPTLQIPAWGMYAEYWLEVDHNRPNDDYIYDFLFTDQVRFYNQRGQMRMDEVPELVLSEVMRDIDLFVGVTSIGNDPNWVDQGNTRMNNYWHDYSFQDLGESSKLRKKTLELIIPKLKIRDKCSFETNYLVVKGSMRTYKIHIGSGNILMKPNDQYLCIVADRKKSSPNLFLPFEEDPTLSIIISKAMLLAEDHKIEDKTILSQIGA